MAHNQTTFGLSGKNGKLTLNGSDLHLNKFALACKTDKAEITNVRSPLMTINGFAMLCAEYLPTVFDGELSFEGEFTIKETAVPVYTGLFFSSGSIMPSFGGVTAGGANGLATVVLIPDNLNNAADTVAGNVVITSFEIDGEIRADVKFKGTATFSGGITVAGNL